MGSIRTASSMVFEGRTIGVVAGVTLAVGNARVGMRLHPHTAMLITHTKSGVAHRVHPWFAQSDNKICPSRSLPCPVGRPTLLVGDGG